MAVPFFGLIMLVLQTGLYHFSLQSLDFAVRTAGRTVMTGQVTVAASSAQSFKVAYVCPEVFWSIACDKLVINSYVLGKSSDSKASSGIYAYVDAKARTLNAPATTPTQQKFCLGQPGDYVYLDVAYPYPNFIGRLLSSKGEATWQMRSSTVVFNEPGAKNAAASC